MLRISFGFVAFAALAVSAMAQAYDVRQDSQLKTPVTISVKYGPVGQVLKSLSKQAGASVEAATAISDLKISVFVKDIPLNVVLDRIGSVLDCHWKNDSGLRILGTSIEDTEAQSKYLAQEDLLLRRKAEDQLDHLVQKTEDADSTGSAGGEVSPLPRFRRGVRAPGNESLTSGISKLFANASSSDMDSFWSGAVLHFEIADRAQSPNVDAPNRPYPRQRSQGGTTVVYARYDYLGTHELQFGTSRSPVVPQSFMIPALTQPTDTLVESRYGKRLLAWQDLTPDANADAFDKPLPPDPGTAIGFRPKTAGGSRDDSMFPQRTQSDLLEKFAAESGLPVVADGFRIVLPPETPDPMGKTPLEWLKSLCSQVGSFVQIKDGVVTVRQGGFWRLRQYEIPEDTLKSMEKNAMALTLDDYAKFFYALTPAQAKSFESTTPPKVQFRIDGIANTIPALRVIGSLSSNFPTNGRPVPVAELSTDTQNLIEDAIAQSVFTGDSWQPAAQGAERPPFYLTLQQSNVSQAEGTVSGVSLQLGLPIGQIVDYQIPLKLVF